MALSANTVLEVRTGGNDTNGGGFVTGASGVDYSQQNSKRTGADVTNISVTDAVANGTTTITSATANFDANIVGNIVYFSGGTGSITGTWRQVTARASTTSITIDASIAASTGMTMNIGGALLSPSIAAGITVTGLAIKIFIQNGTYTISSNTTNTAGGAIGNNSSSACYIGYSSNRVYGNTDTAPIIQTSGSTITQIQTQSCNLYNIVFDGNSQTSSRHASSTPSPIFCTVKNFNVQSTYLNMIACLYTGNTVSVLTTYSLYNEAYGNTATPFGSRGQIRCLSYSNTGATTDGFGGNGLHSECISVANGRDGFGANNGPIINCHAQSNTGFGFKPAPAQSLFLNCTGIGNSGGLIDTSISGLIQYNVTAVSGDVFVNVAGNNYALNNTAGAGAALRAAGRMLATQTYPRGLTTSYFDIGGVQHQDPAGIQMARVFTGM